MLPSKSKSEFPIEQLFAPTSPWEFLGFALITLLMTLMTEGNPVGMVGIVGLFIFWWWLERRKVKARIKHLQAQLLLSVQPQAPLPAKGLILLLSPYSSRQPELQNSQVLDSLLQKICQTSTVDLTEDDFAQIDLLNSNLRPQIEAVKFHLQDGTLKEVWLLSSQSSHTNQGSEVTMAILSKYLQFQYGQRLVINYGQDYTVEDWNYLKLWQTVQKIFQESGYRDEVIVADITGGTKMMSVALAMACVPPQRKMQYMDSKRDWQGLPLPQGEIKPVLIDVDPIFSAKSRN
ncbi:MAG: hypothetical protein F6J89_02615 [Symploca sp. SIO1C4]|uniref:CRISPR-associated protein n=1 Tax=Symploca sp. SIO1C4 TaxID=2607765 RepID=A0A6B3N8U7_9CYAN|nr:hypothetical protein [Symploca sp. SIO2E9]NER26534.1 hypothetical protein [Symploca sp. SIO1C4]